MNERLMKREALIFLLNFTAADFEDETTHGKMRAYKSQYKNGKLGTRSWGTIYKLMGYEPETVWRKKVEV